MPTNDRQEPGPSFIAPSQVKLTFTRNEILVYAMVPGNIVVAIGFGGEDFGRIYESWKNDPRRHLELPDGYISPAVPNENEPEETDH